MAQLLQQSKAGDDSDKLLYPPIEPYNVGRLRLSDVHVMGYEQCGNPEGLPILFIHGGPGGQCLPRDRRFFDPAAYRIILYDQRGSGRSIPKACLDDHNTWILVEDIEKLRTHLGIDKWIVFGGSWGSTLALVYAETHLDRVLGLIVRGIFTLRPSELHWFYQEGASYIFPEAWEEYLDPIPAEERGDLMRAYHRRLTGTDQEEMRTCARAWSTWEMTTSQLLVNPENLEHANDDNWNLAFARIESHYFVNGGFFKNPNHILEVSAPAIAAADTNFPVTIIQGRYDMCCPPVTAWELARRIPRAHLVMVEDAGHSSKERGITAKLVETCNSFKIMCDFQRLRKGVFSFPCFQGLEPQKTVHAPSQNWST